MLTCPYLAHSLSAMTATLAYSALHPARTAREYLRVSKDKSGRAKSTGEQHDDHVPLAEANGWTLHPDPYTDVDKSASRYAEKDRDDFLRLMDDLKADRFGADILIMWESSRGSRQVGEWVEMLDLCERRGILIHVTTHHRTYDPRNGRDRRSLLEDAVDSEYDSYKTSVRMLRSHRASAAAGTPNGKPPVGYVRLYDPVTRVLLKQVPDDSPEARAQAERIAEQGHDLPRPLAPMIRDLFDLTKRGHSMKSIARTFEAAGYVKPLTLDKAGKPKPGSLEPYTPQHLRVLATRHAYTALRVHTPERPQSPDDVTTHEGTWAPLVDRETFWAVQDILSDPDRKTIRPGKGKYLLSMIAVCDECSAPMIAHDVTTSRPTVYKDKNGHAQIRMEDLDAFAEEAILRYIAEGHLGRTISEREAAGEELQAVRGQIADLTARLDALAENTSLSERVLEKRSAALERDLATARQRERDLATPSALAGLIDPDKSLPVWWADAPMSAKRVVAKTLLSPTYLGELRIVRVRRGNQHSRPTVEERVRWRVAEES